MHVGVVGLRHPWQGIQRQAVAHGRVAWDQVHALVAEMPGTAEPRGTTRDALTTPNRQHEAHLVVQSLVEHPTQAHALHFVVQTGVKGVHVHRQTAFTPQVVERVFITRLNMRSAHAQLVGQSVDEQSGIVGAVTHPAALIGKQQRVVPARLTIGAPEDGQGPPGQLLAGIPLTLAKVQEAALTIARAQLVHQFGGQPAFGGPERIGVPLRAITVIDRHKGWLPAHGQAHIACRQQAVHLVAQSIDGPPLRLGVGLGHTWRLENTGDGHVVVELAFALVHSARHRRSPGRFGGARHRNMPLPRQQARGRIQANPASTGQEDLAPGVQVGEVHLGARWAIQGCHVGLELNEVARYKSSGQAQVAQGLHQQPTGVTA